MAAGPQLWEVSDLVALLEEAEGKKAAKQLLELIQGAARWRLRTATK